MKVTARYLVLVSSLVFVFMASITFQAYAAEKVAYVDLGKIFDSYEKTKSYDAQLEKEQESKQKEIDKQVEEIKGMQDKLSLLAEKKKEEQQKKIDEKTRSLQEFQRSAETELMQIRDERLKEILEDIQAQIAVYAEKEGYDMVFNDRVLLYKKPGDDISDAILKLLNSADKK